MGPEERPSTKLESVMLHSSEKLAGKGIHNTCGPTAPRSCCCKGQDDTVRGRGAKGAKSPQTNRFGLFMCE
jgi:hypothetical protein